MSFEIANYQDFYTMNDLDVQKKLIHLIPYPSDQLITPKSLSDGQDFLTTFIIKKGEIWADLLFTGWPGVYVVSKKFKDSLGFINGVNYIPVKIIEKGLNKIGVDYFRLQILGKSGGLKKEMSKRETATRIPNGPTYIKFIGLFFDLNTWDGSEIFSPQNTLHVFITSKVKDLIEDNKLTNIKILPISDVEAFFV